MRTTAAVFSPHPGLLSPVCCSYRKLRLMTVSTNALSGYFLSDKGLSQVMKDVSQNPLHASIIQILGFPGAKTPSSD